MLILKVDLVLDPLSLKQLTSHTEKNTIYIFIESINMELWEIVDKCHICIGLVGYLLFILGDLYEYSCVIFTPISPITLGFGLLSVDCRFLLIQAKFLGEM